MKNEWDIAISSLSQITVSSHPNNEPVTIIGQSGDLTCIGVGTDAAVFQSIHAQAYAFKIFSKDKLLKRNIEENVYKKIGHSKFFPRCYGGRDNYLVLSFEKGMTLFDCLLHGIHIPKQVIIDVEDAREYIRQKGLNPRDIHLKNIILQNGRAKLLDVSEYMQPGNDYRWEHLKNAYDEHYHLIDGRSIPLWMIELVRKRYKQWHTSFTSYEEFMKFVLKFLHGK